ncbi:MAG: hypothetical protein IT435_10360 [Phycisphaerales bacterium]|nr:hypothetical protein [Phycisphaerales bacterium]
MFITDRDLLAVEPNLFRDIVWAGQRLCKATASTLNTTLTITGADVDFNDAQIAPGHVATVDGASYEVVDVIAGNELTISRIRPTTADFAIPVSPMSDKPMWIVTFAPQIGVIHRQILRMLGLEPAGDSVPAGTPTEAHITNGIELAPIETFGALYLILSAAAAAAGPQSPLGIRAAFYRSLFSQERARAIAELDVDGDGRPELIRRMNIAALQRT